jgi:ubiquinone/menaquinone biosynthesis C-methylase UbiE
MKLNGVERLLVNSRARALVQRFYEAPLLLRLGGPMDGRRVLDVGCGRGVGVELLLRQFRASHVCGIDLESGQIDRARKRLAGKYDGRVILKVGSVERLPFVDASFDAVFDFGMLHHVPVWQTGIAEIRRVLKPGGTFLFEEVTRAALERWVYRTFLEHPAENRFSEAEFVAELASHGLEPTGAIRRVLFSDIFIGVAKLPET